MRLASIFLSLGLALPWCTAFIPLQPISPIGNLRIVTRPSVEFVGRSRPYMAARIHAGQMQRTDLTLREGLKTDSLEDRTASVPPLIICGPSGVGKGTLVSKLQQEFGDAVGLCVSHTTRLPRPGEVHGIHYYFVSKCEMEEAIKKGQFLEFAEVHGNLYGTARTSLQAVQDRGCLCMIDVDVQGTRSLRAAGIQGTYVFIAPPSFEVLEQRLRSRGTETEEVVLRRLSAAKREIDASAETQLFDHVVCNDNLESAYAHLKSLVAPSLRASVTRRMLSTALSVASSPTISSAFKPEDSSNKVTPVVVFVLGGPGSGKGTQCGLLKDRFKCIHLSAGDLLRAEQNNQGSPYSTLINTCITEGKIVPVEITCRLLANAMNHHMDTAQQTANSYSPAVFLIDGFPRNMDNLNGWIKEAGQDARVVLFFDCSEQTLQDRLLERGKTSGRADDNIQSIQKRFNTFQKETMPVVEYFKNQGSLREIDAEKDVESVFAEVQQLLLREIPELR